MQKCTTIMMKEGYMEMDIIIMGVFMLLVMLYP
jgi:hypothetical protein